MADSIELPVVPGVVVRVFAHTLHPPAGPVACFTYVTQGLSRFGQREIALTLARRPEEGLDRAPQSPLQLIAPIASLAAQGRLVDAGGFTEVGPSGLFGRPRLRGLGYESAAPMEGVDLPQRCLQAVVLVEHELETAKGFGALRVLARLGRSQCFYPTACWCDPDRPAVGAPETQSILGGVPRLGVPGVSARLDGDRITVRIARAAQQAIAQALTSLPLEAALALLTSLDDHADGCLVWEPGQSAPAAITPPGSAGRHLSGCFVLFVPQQPADEGRLHEDGFALMLTDASSLRIRGAIGRGESVVLAASGFSIAIEIEGLLAS
ncbi:MAG: hypothetical protein IT378_27785 [Sandaracinaceae bacterium]|nr:hypothetical protein [Sandaracinaceae bacterium]